MNSDVLITGAGPTGLVLALWLTKQGVKVRIIDKLPQPSTTSRAVAVQARTLELYQQLDLTDAILAKGHPVPAVNLWVQGKTEARISFEHIAADLTPYGPLTFGQDQHERLLIAKLKSLGVEVERLTELIGYTGDGNHVIARLRHADGSEERCEAAYLAGCDGARSLVRQTMGAGFPGGTYQQIFYVADIEGSGPAFDGELHVDLDEADFLAIFPLDDSGRARLIGTVRDERAQHADTLKFEDVSERAISRMKVKVDKVNWFSTYHVHHRVTNRFRKGRAFLLGDAAHIHSPAGGQGMNTGIGDAINLAWKLKAVLGCVAPDTLLDSYEPERRAFALKLVASTDRGFTLATAEGRIADFIRTRIIPVIVPPLFKFEAARDFMFSAVSQISLNYRDGPISFGKSGDIRGGDRLPWAPVPGHDNFASLKEIGWQVHVYGTASEALSTWCRDQQLPLEVFAWHEEHEKAGFAKDAFYLIRPDAYIAVVHNTQHTRALEHYFRKIGVGLK
jgi:2-polyprenyl-6-methoxyphenol hydroxylase-like FAD-dependent oxidoreductase